MYILIVVHLLITALEHALQSLYTHTHTHTHTPTCTLAMLTPLHRLGSKQRTRTTIVGDDQVGSDRGLGRKRREEFRLRPLLRPQRGWWCIRISGQLSNQGVECGGDGKMEHTRRYQHEKYIPVLVLEHDSRDGPKRVGRGKGDKHAFHFFYCEGLRWTRFVWLGHIICHHPGKCLRLGHKAER